MRLCRSFSNVVIGALALLAIGCSEGPQTPRDLYTDACVAQFKQFTQWGGIARGNICACRARMSSEFLTGEQMRSYAENPMEFTMSVIGSDLAEDVKRVENRCTTDFCERYNGIEAEMCAFFRANLDD